MADWYLSADKDFLILLHISQVRRPICWPVCPPHGLPRLPGFLFWWFKLLGQATYNSYSSVFRPGLQPSKEGQRCLDHSAFVQSRRTEEQKLLPRFFTITPTLRVPKAKGFEAFRLSAVYVSNTLKFHSLTSKGKVEDKPPRAEVSDTSEWKKKKNMAGQCSPFLLPDLRLLDWADDWVRRHVMQ